MKPDPVDAAIWLIAVQVLLAFVLIFALLTVAYSFDGVGSWDELPLLGRGPAIAVLGAWLPPLVCVPIAVIMLASGFRAFAWVVPALGVTASVTIWLLAVSTFEQPVFHGG